MMKTFCVKLMTGNALGKKIAPVRGPVNEQLLKYIKPVPFLQ